MLLLAIDTSTDQASVALSDDSVPRGEWSWMAGGNHSRHLTRVIGEVLAVGGSAVTDLQGIAVAIGPGSFSGIRVGLSVAKGLAMARDLPLVGVATLDIIGFQALFGSREVWAALPAGRGQVYLAHYAGDPQSWHRTGEYLIATLPEAAMTVGNAVLAGAGAQALAQVLRDQGREPRLEPPPARLRRAAYLAELGNRYLESGGADQLDRLEPLYLRPSAAEENAAAQCRE